MSEQSDAGWKMVAADWLVRQSFPAAMLILQTAALMYFTHFVIVKALPQVVGQIQVGYERLELQQKERVDQLRKDNLERFNAIILSMEKDRAAFQNVADRDRQVFLQVVQEMVRKG